MFMLLDEMAVLVTKCPIWTNLFTLTFTTASNLRDETGTVWGEAAASGTGRSRELITEPSILLLEICILYMYLCPYLFECKYVYFPQSFSVVIEAGFLNWTRSTPLSARLASQLLLGSLVLSSMSSDNKQSSRPSWYLCACRESKNSGSYDCTAIALPAQSPC